MLGDDTKEEDADFTQLVIGRGCKRKEHHAHALKAPKGMTPKEFAAQYTTQLPISSRVQNMRFWQKNQLPPQTDVQAKMHTQGLCILLVPARFKPRRALHLPRRKCNALAIVFRHRCRRERVHPRTPPRDAASGLGNAV